MLIVKHLSSIRAINFKKAVQTQEMSTYPQLRYLDQVLQHSSWNTTRKQAASTKMDFRQQYEQIRSGQYFQKGE